MIPTRLQILTIRIHPQALMIPTRLQIQPIPDAPSDSAATDGNESADTASGGEQENAAVEEDNAEGTEDQAARLAGTTENGEIQVKLPPEFDSEGGEAFVYTLPPDTFVHTNSEGKIMITVALVNGETVTDLPADMTFNSATGQVTGRLPDNAEGIFAFAVYGP